MRSPHVAGFVRPRHILAASVLTVLAVLADGRLVAQQVVPGNNVNMVSGTQFPTGDPFLQRQNEPSLAVSTRNPLHLLAGANDYRTVDLPGPFDPLRGEKMNADAWLGLFKSFDGGRTWQSTLLPGFPQDVSAAGLASPIKGRQAGTDAVVKAGTNGLFYYAGLAFDRGQNAPSTIFVSRFIDLNNRENGDPIEYLGTQVVDSDTGTRFLDKTSLAVDVPRGVQTCTITTPRDDGGADTQTIPAGNVYVAYSSFTGSGTSQQSQILFSRSADCGLTWSAPKNLSTGNILNQNAQIAISPSTGHVWVSWRRFQAGTLQSDGIFITRSIDGGVTFSRPVRVAPVSPFDQGTTGTSFRTNAFQTMTVDDTGRVYVAWPQRGHAILRPDRLTGDARIVVSTSTNGSTWSAPAPIETGGLGHQIMPALSFHGGKLRLIYYDLREDVSQVFGQFVDELPILTAPDPKPPRHTIDVYVAQAAPAAQPLFNAVRLSDYAFGTVAGSPAIQRLQYNPPNLPLFRQGTAPFMGDYIDLASAPAFVLGADGVWRFNTAPTTAAVSHGVWTDNRDVRAPLDGDWTNYTPVLSDSLGAQSLFDPTQTVRPCSAGQTGSRNQNIYTAKVTEGLFVGSPGNAKPLGLVQRAFVIIVENARDASRSYRLEILNQPPGGEASFQQFAAVGTPLTAIDASIPPFSTIARTVYVTSTDPLAQVQVGVTEIGAPGAAPLPGGQSSTVVLNGDRTTPSIQNPSIQNPSIQNPDIQVAEAYNPAITTAFLAPSIQNPSIQNPSIQNPSIQNPSIQNPELTNDAIANPGIISPSIQNPSIQNPSIQNPSIQNPSIQNQDLVNGAIQDTTWVVSNDGNTTASYAIKLIMNGSLPAGFKSQLVLHKTYKTPTAQDCTLALQPHTILLANIPNPAFTPEADVANPSIQNPSIQNATLSLAPGESANVTLRIVDPDRFDGIEFDAGAAIAPAAVAHAVNTVDAAQGITTPRVAVPLTIRTGGLAGGTPGGAYSATLQAFAASGATSWSVTQGALPPGVTLNSTTGQISGTPTAPGHYVFTVQAVDSSGHIDQQTLAIKIDPIVPAGFTRIWNGADSDWFNPRNWSPAGVPAQADSVYVASSIPVMPALTADVTITDILVESGATLDTNGFTLTLLGNGDAGNTIVGGGTVVMQGQGVTARGTFPNLTIGGRVTVAGPLAASGRLMLLPGASFDLNGHAVVAGGPLRANAGGGTAAVLAGAGGSLSVAGVDVNGLTLDRVLLTISGGVLAQFDNVRFVNYRPEDVQLTINHTGTAAPFTMSGLSFFVPPTQGLYLHASDPIADGQSLVVNVSASLPADGSSRTIALGGAVVNWLVTSNSASVAVSQSVSPDPAVAGVPLTYAVVVANGGPAAASNVVLTNPLPGATTFVSAIAQQGSCGVSAGLVSCSLGSIAAGQTVVVTMVVIPGAPGVVTNAVSVTANEPDPAPGDNAQTLNTRVFAASAAADLSVTKNDSADPAPSGAPLTYTVAVGNAGPATATSVVVTDAMPPGVTATQATSTRGGCSVAGGIVTCLIGSLAPGEQAIVTIAASASAFGIVANTAVVRAAEADPDPSNNSATELTTVGAAVCAAPTFSGPFVYAGPTGPATHVKLADMDGDGDLDIVTAHQAPAGAVSVLLNDGVAGFGQPVVASPGVPAFVNAVADFDGDGDQDVMIGLGGTPNTVRLLLGDGTGALAPTGAPIPLGSGFLVEALDIDGDGDQDVLARGTANDLILLRNNGAAVFAPPVSLFGGPIGLTLAIGDYNEDGRTDLVVARTDARFTVLIGNADGTFTATGDFQTTTAPRVRALGDLNGDGHLDLGITEGNGVLGTARLTLRFGTGTGAFGAEVDIAGGNTLSATASADFNGDGRLDLVSNHALNRIGVQLGDGTGGFSAPAYFISTAFSNPAAGDLNGDGRLDVVTGDVDGAIGVLLNSCGRPATDLALTVTESADPVNEGDEFTYTVTVANQSGSDATNVLVGSVIMTSINSTFPPNATITSTASVAGVLVSGSDGSHVWTFPTLAANSSLTIEFRVRAHAGGTVWLTSGVSSDNADTDASNNTRVESTTITAVGRDMAVTNTNDSGPGSLRKAIADSNGDAGDVDRIVFAIPGSGPHTITPVTALPTLSQPAIVDATTQPGYAGTPVIELNGNGLAATGLSVSGGNTAIRGLAINRFGGVGIFLSTNGGNVVEGNFIGTDLTGTVARPNSSHGVVITSPNNRVGGPTAAARNLISGNQGTGINIQNASATGNVIQGNFVGTNASGTGAVPNQSVQSGIFVANGASNNTIGGPAQGAGNVVSGNAQHAVTLVGATTAGNVIQGNFIGTDPTGTVRVANAGIGIDIVSALNTLVGGPAGARNIISGNGTGMQIRTGATGTLVQNNYIGVGATGAAALSNGLGISILDSANGNTIGGTTTAAGNVISGNQIGVRIASSSGNSVQGNLIGTSATGAAALPNTSGGVSIVDGSSNTIGGLTPAARNVISGNQGPGVGIFGSAATGNLVRGNYIGTNAAGTAAIGNASGGVAIGNAASANVIGGLAAAAGNVISGNASGAVNLFTGATGNELIGNLIGTTAAGTAPLGNSGSSIYVDGPNNTIGGSSPAASNVIAATAQFSGIHLDPNATGTVIRGNFIGTDRTGTLDLGGIGDGIYIRGSNNTVGGQGPGEGNSIRFNRFKGVVVETGTGNRISGNVIADNGQPGIDLVPFGITLNDAGDTDSGPNDLQNFPVITSAALTLATTGNTTAIQGTLDSTPNTTFRLEFFSNTTCDPSGHGEGQRFVGSADVTTNANGAVAFSATVSAAGNVTATATDPNGNTSEFSACAPVTGIQSYLVFPNRGLNALQVFDPASQTIVRTLPLPAPYTYAGAAMLSTAIVRPDGSIVTNARDASGAALALKLSGTGTALAAQISGGDFLQQIAFDPADASLETVVGGTPFLEEVRAVNPAGGTAVTKITRANANFIGLVTATSGDIYAGVYCGPDNGAVLVYDSAGSFIRTFAQVGTATGSCEVNALARDDTGSVYVAQNSSNRLAKFDSSGTFVSFITAPSFNAPAQVFFNPRDGLLYVGNSADDRLTILTPQGTLVNVVRMGGSGIGVPGASGSNAPPVANAGPDQDVPVGSIVQLDGSGSSDPDGNPLTWTWILNTKPAGSAAVLSATDIANPTFVADVPGTYIAQLVVNDGSINSPSDTVTIATRNQAPIANAGPDQRDVPVSSTVTLDGTASNDPDGQPVSYVWSFLVRPATSAATLLNATTAAPSFVADRGGLYRLQLIVSDGQVSSAADTVDIITVNQPPAADAGADQNVLVGATVHLSGAGSRDPDDNPLTFAWTLVAKPAGSAATLSGPSAVDPSFVPDVAGAYTVRLVVNDGFVDSAPDDATVTVRTNDISLALVGTPLVGAGRQATLEVTLPTPAPGGGVTVTVTSDDTGVVTVGPPDAITIAGGASSGLVTVNGISIGSTIVRAAAPGYSNGSLSVTTTNNVLNAPATLNVPFGQTASLPITIPQPAPPGGVVVNLVSSSPALIEVLTPSVTIPAGALSANGTVRGLGFGTATVSATNPSFSTASSEVSSTGNLNIVQPSAALRPAFPTTITVQLESGGSAVAAPPPGVIVNLTAADAGCLSVPAQATIAAGLVSTSVPLNYGGSTTLPCTTTLAAGSGGLTSDTITVTVNPDPDITLSGLPVTVGAGLQTNFNPFCCGLAAFLGESQHGGTTVRIRSSDPSIALVSTAAGTVGSEFIDVPLVNGSTSVSYYVHGVAPGSATITATAAKFRDVSGTVTVAQASLQLVGGSKATTSLSPNTDLQVAVGLPTADGSGLFTEQGVRAGQTLTATLANSNAAVAQLVKQGGVAGQSLPVTITSGNARSPFGITSGGIAFDPTDIGTTTVTAAIPGFVATAAASRTFTINQPALSMQGLGLAVGAGLQTNFNPFCCQLGVALDSSLHGGTDVLITSSNPDVARVSANASTAGAASIVVFVPNGQTFASFYVQGLVATGSPVTITATAGRFSSASGTVSVVQPAVRLSGVPTVTTSQSPNADFQVAIGVPSADNSFLVTEQAVRAGQTVVATVSNSAAAVAQLATQTIGPSQSVQVTIGAGQTRSPGNFSTGGVTFDPVGGGTTTVSATIPGFIATTAASADVTVNAPTMNLQGLPVGVGAGLATNFNPFCCGLAVVLDASEHGGVTVTLTSGNPAVLKLAASASDPGADSIRLVIPNGQTFASYYVQGVEGTTGSATVTAVASGFTSTQGVVTVQQPALRLVGPGTSTTSLSPDTDFFVAVGVPDSANSGLLTEQAVRTGGSLTATIVNSNAAVAQLKKGANVGQSLTVAVPAGQSRSATTFAAGGLAFDPIGGGTTTVSASIPGYIATAAASVTVTVGAPALAMQGLPLTVGSGLQTNFNPFCCLIGVSLATPQHGGVTVTITSSNPAVALVAPDAATAGARSIDVLVPDGQNFALYHVQGVENATGTVTIQASASGFTDASGTLTVVQPALRLVGLPASTTNLSPDSDFQVAVGLPDGTNAGLIVEQAVRAGGTLVATVTNGDARVARLATLVGGAAQTVQIAIPAGHARSVFGFGSGGVAFDPLAAGSTVVSAAIPGLIATAQSSVTVSVTAPPITMQGFPLPVGAGLQTAFNPFCCTIGAVLGASGHNGVTVRITSQDPSMALVAPDATTAGQPFIDVAVPAGQTFAPFYVQGIAVGAATITAAAAGFEVGSGVVDVFQAALQIEGLVSSIDATASSDLFSVAVGVPNQFGTSLVFTQEVRAGSSISVTVTNSDAGVAQLVTSSGGDQLRTVIIGPGQSRSPATIAAGGVEFDPLNVGTTTVTATSATVGRTDAATVTVQVTPRSGG